MNKICNNLQEKLACAASLEQTEQQHLSGCSDCQNVFADYQMLMVLLDEEDVKVEIPDSFSENVMKAIEQNQNKSDWYDRALKIFERLLEKPVIQYGSLATGFGLGVLTFIRFVAFVFIPA